MMKLRLCLIAIVASATMAATIANAEVTREVRSPSGRVQIQISIPKAGSSEPPHWMAIYGKKNVLTDCKLSLDVVDQGNLLAGAQINSEKSSRSNKRIPVLFGKSAFAQDNFREIRLELQAQSKLPITVVFRCYDDAIAFRYEVNSPGPAKKLVVADEMTSFKLADNPKAYVQYLENYFTSHEHAVDETSFDTVKTETLLDMPTTFVYENGIHVAITEAALRHYAGMSLLKSAVDSSLVCKLTPRPDGTKVVCDGDLQTPWRVVLIGERAGSLLESNTLYCLNKPNEIGNTDWIKPGKMSWPWWNGNIVSDGKAEPPIFSIEAQKHYIDFCAANGIAFHSTIANNTDTPWYFQTKQGVSPGPDTDVTKVRPGLDLAGILQYGRSKGVRSWTWVHQGALRGHVEEAFATFERLGWSGMMVDFFDHDDQDSVEHAEAILKAAANHHILIHFHGIWKPTGWQRTFPNLMNHEGSLNLEYLKWSNRCTPDHTMKILFTRMVAGPMDYHLGGFRAAKPSDFSVHYVAPQVMGTRGFMLAMYVCIDNPNPMIADYPDAYTNQPGFDFLKLVPTWWDETRILAGEIGHDIVTARRKGDIWYLGGMGSRDKSNLKIALSFLRSGPYEAKIWKDGPDSNANPNQVSTESLTVTRASILELAVASDGGFVVQLTPVKH